jgi:hypothetical protein
MVASCTFAVVQGLLWIELLEKVYELFASVYKTYFYWSISYWCHLVAKHKLCQLLWYMHMPGLRSPVAYIQMKDRPSHLNQYVLIF